MCMSKARPCKDCTVWQPQARRDVQILSGYTVEGALPAAALINTSGISLTTINGLTLSIAANDGNITVTSDRNVTATVVIADIPACGSVLHIVDVALYPPRRDEAGGIVPFGAPDPAAPEGPRGAEGEAACGEMGGPCCGADSGLATGCQSDTSTCSGAGVCEPCGGHGEPICGCAPLSSPYPPCMLEYCVLLRHSSASQAREWRTTMIDHDILCAAVYPVVLTRGVDMHYATRLPRAYTLCGRYAGGRYAFVCCPACG